MRTWLVAAALIFLPLLVYWPTVSHEYGFRDDYAHLREVRERPGWLTELTTANGRPVYGLVLEASLNDVRVVADLAALRLAGTLLLSLVGVLLWWHLRRSAWSESEAAALGAATTLLPGAQVIAGWAIAWPIALGLAAAVTGFALVDRGLAQSGMRRVAQIAAGGALYLAAGLTYQTSAMFVVMPLAAVLLMRGRALPLRDASWVVAHLGALFVSLVAGLLLMNVVFTEGLVREAARMQLEPDPLIKLLWFVRQPLPNSLALFPLRDRFDTPLSFWLVLAAVVAVAVLGFLHGAKDRHQKLRWLFVALALPFVAHSVSLAASSQAIGYRTLLPLSGVFLVLAVFGVRSVVARHGLGRAAEASVLGVLLLTAAWLAYRNPSTLIADPQGHEWRLVREAATRITLDGDTSIYLIRPTIADRSTERVYADEYGSLSADAEWAAKEMVSAAIRQRYPAGLPEGTAYTLATGFAPPATRFDVVIDLRELKNQGERAPSAAATVSRR